ncbi:CTP synthase, partial [Patescibacteria group bacterium]|nr:CTP synthase [Patescibacteria group bacterium]
MRTRYLFVIGGVMSGVGKGISVASLGTILQAKGFNVSAIKIDPYINVDAGTMNPTEHGEVFVTEDGDETDQDIGSYERFLDKNILSTNYLTTGRVYKTVIERERNLEYNGRCVEVVPDIPNEVIRRIEYAAKVTGAEFMLVEIGGTVGEYQNLIFLEAARMMKLKDPTGVLSILVSYLPVPEKVGEMKTKPTQYAARTLNSAGIQPDMIIARSAVPLDNKRKEKISVFCNITSDDVISAPDVDNVYQVPLNFERDKISTRILNKFKVRPRTRDLKEWRALQDRIARAHKEVHIGIVGKYFGTGDFVLSDSYLSVIESIKHAAWANNAVPRIQWLDAEEYEKHPEKLHELKQFDGIIVPGGFGSRGVEGKIRAIEYVRKNKIPYFGLCYGMQLAVIEFARNVAKLSGAHTAEINPKAVHKIIDLMMEQKQNL